MSESMKLISFTDFVEYELPQEDLFGKCRATNEFAKSELLGQGSFSKVYKAKDTRNNRVVTMKYITNSCDQNGIKLNVLREINILSGITHPNIVSLYDLAVEPVLNNEVCLIMEYGQLSLDKLIDQYPEERIPENQVKCIVKQLCEAINFLHARHVVHRDIKPTNVLINGEGIVKLIDFGQARVYTEPPRPMTPDVSTLWYRAPEVLFQAPTYSSAIDMWSLGCILGELFEREPIFKGSSHLDQINLIIHLIGSPNQAVWPGFKKTEYFRKFSVPNQPYNAVNERFKQVSVQANSLLVSMLIYDPERRIKTSEFLNSKWFKIAPIPSASVTIPKNLQRPTDDP